MIFCTDVENAGLVIYVVDVKSMFLSLKVKIS